MRTNDWHAAPSLHEIGPVATFVTGEKKKMTSHPAQDVAAHAAQAAESANNA